MKTQLIFSLLSVLLIAGIVATTGCEGTGSDDKLNASSSNSLVVGKWAFVKSSAVNTPKAAKAADAETGEETPAPAPDMTITFMNEGTFIVSGTVGSASGEYKVNGTAITGSMKKTTGDKAKLSGTLIGRTMRLTVTESSRTVQYNGTKQ